MSPSLCFVCSLVISVVAPLPVTRVLLSACPVVKQPRPGTHPAAQSDKDGTDQWEAAGGWQKVVQYDPDFPPSTSSGSSSREQSGSRCPGLEMMETLCVVKPTDRWGISPGSTWARRRARWAASRERSWNEVTNILIKDLPVYRFWVKYFFTIRSSQWPWNMSAKQSRLNSSHFTLIQF